MLQLPRKETRQRGSSKIEVDEKRKKKESSQTKYLSYLIGSTVKSAADPLFQGKEKKNDDSNKNSTGRKQLLVKSHYAFRTQGKK